MNDCDIIYTMSHTPLEKEVSGFNKTAKQSSFLTLPGKSVSGNRFSAGIAMFTAPTADSLKDKKQGNRLKETRKQLGVFFKQKKNILQPGKNLFLFSLPEQLVKVIDLACQAPGFNRKLNTGEELFSLVCLSREDPVRAIHNALRLLDILGNRLFYYHFEASISFADYKIKQVIPVDFHEPVSLDFPASESPHIFSIEEIKDFEILCRNYHSLPKNAVDPINTGIRYLDLVQKEENPHVAVSLLTAAVELFIGSSEKEPQWYFAYLCSQLAERAGFQPTNEKQFHDFYSLGLSPERSGKQINLLAEMNVFFRLLLKKCINDNSFRTQVLPRLKTSARKELKKNDFKKRWRRFPGKYLERLVREP